MTDTRMAVDLVVSHDTGNGMSTARNGALIAEVEH